MSRVRVNLTGKQPESRVAETATTHSFEGWSRRSFSSSTRKKSFLIDSVTRNSSLAGEFF